MRPRCWQMQTSLVSVYDLRRGTRAPGPPQCLPDGRAELCVPPAVSKPLVCKASVTALEVAFTQCQMLTVSEFALDRVRAETASFKCAEL